MTDFVLRARAFLAAHHPDADIAFLGGSAATGHATATSDLTSWSCSATAGRTRPTSRRARMTDNSSRRSSTARPRSAPGPPAAAPNAAPCWIALRPRAFRSPKAPRPRTGRPRRARSWQPAPPRSPAAETDARRYALTSLLDDLAEPRDDVEAAVVAAATWREAAELALGLDRHWLGTGKWLLRALRESDETDRFGLIAAARLTDRAQVAAAGHAVLDAAGGRLQEGHLRCEKP
ncbi:hypothetical protein HJ588_06405 [Flexivirga sp. ID2601S]|uniref:Nucleotidyltransferase domain-containing protein n=1 Tax=Flexivirga aerilata TaxID=1656889 RepID=A0A849AEI5_9MICO|nr:hypothetical protein [Flexivirga aerilata]NNG38905.1 hypothetical protein [Flexivirga aerilata]